MFPAVFGLFELGLIKPLCQSFPQRQAEVERASGQCLVGAVAAPRRSWGQRVGEGVAGSVPS